MKQPKEPKTFEYPRLYIRESVTNDMAEAVIVYPDGRLPERTALLHNGSVFSVDGKPGHVFRVCWYECNMSPKEQVVRLKRFSLYHNIKSYFAGEIK